MGGKILKYPVRGKYKPYTKKTDPSFEKEDNIDSEEHKKRVDILKQLGLIKKGNKDE